MKYIIILIMSLFLFNIAYTQTVWEVPKKYKNMENPYKDKIDPASMSIGRFYWNKSCKSCHGAEGKGDGVRASLIKVPMRDFSLQEFKLQTDGELYYKSIIGHEKMPNFEKVIETEEDRWLLINYIKTL